MWSNVIPGEESSERKWPVNVDEEQVRKARLEREKKKIDRDRERLWLRG